MTEPVHVAEMRVVRPEIPVSFEDFFEAENPALFRRLWLITANRAEAEEIAQEAFLKVWERWDRIGSMDDPVGYLYRTAMNVFRQRYRRGRVAIRRTMASPSAHDDFADVEDQDLVGRILGSLPARQRAALVLTELLGFSAEEAGSVLGVKASTIRSLSRNARDSARRTEVPDA